MSRQCGWCVHPRRVEFERRAMAGESIRVISLDTGHSESAAHRHLRNHVQPELLSQLRPGATTSMHVSDFVSRLVLLAEESADVRTYARQANDPRLLLQATREERETLSAIMTKLGVDDTEVADLINEAKVLVLACAAVLSGHADVARQLANEVAKHGADELAAGFLQLAERTEQQQIEPTTPPQPQEASA